MDGWTLWEGRKPRRSSQPPKPASRPPTPTANPPPPSQPPTPTPAANSPSPSTPPARRPPPSRAAPRAPPRSTPATPRAPDADNTPAAPPPTAAAYPRGELPIPVDAPAPAPIAMPGRPPRPTLVHPRHLPRRGFGTAEGRAAFIHAVAHIEFNAMDLAWDAVYRFRGLPAQYYADWVGVARDEARHFNLLRARLRELGQIGRAHV